MDSGVYMAEISERYQFLNNQNASGTSAKAARVKPYAVTANNKTDKDSAKSSNLAPLDKDVYSSAETKPVQENEDSKKHKVLKWIGVAAGALALTGAGAVVHHKVKVVDKRTIEKLIDFVPAETLEDAEKFAQTVLGIKKTNYSNGELGYVNFLNEALVNVYNKGLYMPKELNVLSELDKKGVNVRGVCSPLGRKIWLKAETKASVLEALKDILAPGVPAELKGVISKQTKEIGELNKVKEFIEGLSCDTRSLKDMDDNIKEWLGLMVKDKNNNKLSEENLIKVLSDKSNLGTLKNTVEINLKDKTDLRKGYDKVLKSLENPNIRDDFKALKELECRCRRIQGKTTEGTKELNEFLETGSGSHYSRYIPGHEIYHELGHLQYNVFNKNEGIWARLNHKFKPKDAKQILNEEEKAFAKQIGPYASTSKSEYVAEMFSILMHPEIIKPDERVVKMYKAYGGVMPD